MRADTSGNKATRSLPPNAVPARDCVRIGVHVNHPYGLVRFAVVGIRQTNQRAGPVVYSCASIP
jgi:hypothetical protein